MKVNLGKGARSGSCCQFTISEDSRKYAKHKVSALDVYKVKSKEEIVANWLPRYTDTPLKDFGKYILLVNFEDYLNMFSEWFDAPIRGRNNPMPNVTNGDITLINFGMGSANAATIMDLLSSKKPRGVLFLGKCGGLKKSTEIGHFILPIAAIRGEGTSDDYFPEVVPAMPSFKLHKYVSEVLVENKLDYRTGVVYTTNRRVWEWDERFKRYLRKVRALAIDMETATIFITGLANEIARGALLLVSDRPMVPEGIKTAESDKKVTKEYVNMHLEMGIDALSSIDKTGDKIKHFGY